MWQDLAISVVQWFFVAALIPAIRHATGKPPLSSSLPTAIGCYLLAFTFSTLLLWMSVLSAAASGVAWTILALQRYRIDRQQQKSRA